MKYKINIHAHTIFSDGSNSPAMMAIMAKKLGFTALVITDHYYGNIFADCSLNKDKYRLLKKACKEAKGYLPVIIGIELAIAGQEILVFGSAAINEIFTWEEIGKERTIEAVLELKKKNDCAFVLCHPGDPDHWESVLPLIDGFEKYNSGQDWFKNRPYGCLEGRTMWCNSDAHSAMNLDRGCNIVDTKIETESDLIRYIKSGKQPEPLLMHREDLD